MWKVQQQKQEAEKRAKQQLATALISMDYYLMELFDAMQEGCEKKVGEAKERIRVIHRDLVELNYFK